MAFRIEHDEGKKVESSIYAYEKKTFVRVRYIKQKKLYRIRLNKLRLVLPGFHRISKVSHKNRKGRWHFKQKLLVIEMEMASH